MTRQCRPIRWCFPISPRPLRTLPAESFTLMAVVRSLLFMLILLVVTPPYTLNTPIKVAPTDPSLNSFTPANPFVGTFRSVGFHDSFKRVASIDG